jgi:putative heme-binding domain-containing protein
MSRSSISWIICSTLAFISLSSSRLKAEDVAGRELLDYPEKQHKVDLPPASLPLQFAKGEHVAFVGGGTAERMNLFGHFETMLHLRFPEKELVIRNFARPADEVAEQWRPGNYSDLDDPLRVFQADTYFCFYGFNESYKGPAGIDEFKKSYRDYLTKLATIAAEDAPGKKIRFALVTPIAFEDANDPLVPKSSDINRNLALYSQAISEVGAAANWPVINVFNATSQKFADTPGLQWTQNGLLLNEEGDRLAASLIDRQLFPNQALSIENARYEKLRSMVNEKSWHHLQDYRMLNGWYVYGGRRTWDTETFPREYNKIRAMVRNRDIAAWAIAAGKEVGPIDDSKTGELFEPATRFGDPRQDYSEAEELRYLTPDELIQSVKIPDGFEVKLFADETMFPELAKPVQLSFDNKGRLWVACMPTYPQWKPGDKHPDDKLLILEDTDKDGRADKCTTFYDKLHCPTGFELYNGGVIVTDQPRLIFLKDVDGDDRADVSIDLIDGWGTDDTHHTIGAFEMSPSGLLYMLEGVSMNTTIETPWGPQRWRGAAGAYILNPRTLKVERFTTPGYGNPWCMTFDPWGQGIVGDGTGAQQHWATGLSGSQKGPRRGLDPIFDNQGMRPVVGNEFLYSRNFPDDMQGHFVYACVINMNGMPRFTVNEDGAAFSGQRIEDLLSSPDKHFRPTDPQIGPDGALWFGDWANALIGHMQYSQRDPNRDHVRGRIYRMFNTKKPLVEPVTQFDKSEAELLEQLREYEPRTRYRVRAELQSRPTEAVRAAVLNWLSTLDASDPAHDRLVTEGLWALQQHEIVDRDVLDRVLKLKADQARVAGVRFVADMRNRIPDAMDIYAIAVKDAHIRVRAEAARALSFETDMKAVELLMQTVDQPTDKWMDYMLEHSIGALESVWSEAYSAGKLANVSEAGMKAIDAYLATARPGLAAAPFIKTLLTETEVRHQVKRNNAYAALENLRGNARNGKNVFKRVCANCHQVAGEGYKYGPELTDVGRRINRHDLIESIIEPSAKMDKKYQNELVMLDNDEVLTGFIGEETDTEILLLMPEGKSRRLKKDEIVERKLALQSSMPENLGGTISPSEFLDIIDYLAELR